MYYIIADQTRNTVRIIETYRNSCVKPFNSFDDEAAYAMSETKINIRDYPIKLGQFLKRADIVQDGFEAKFLILDGKISVNGIVEKRRGRQLKKNDRVQSGDHIYVCV